MGLGGVPLCFLFPNYTKEPAKRGLLSFLPGEGRPLRGRRFPPSRLPAFPPSRPPVFPPSRLPAAHATKDVTIRQRSEMSENLGLSGLSGKFRLN